jgi:hypothetical protein
MILLILFLSELCNEEISDNRRLIVNDYFAIRYIEEDPYANTIFSEKYDM